MEGKTDDEKINPMLQWQRSLSISSANSIEGITQGASVMARVPSIRTKKVGEFEVHYIKSQLSKLTTNS